MWLSGASLNMFTPINRCGEQPVSRYTRPRINLGRSTTRKAWLTACTVRTSVISIDLVIREPSGNWRFDAQTKPGPVINFFWQLQCCQVWEEIGHQANATAIYFPDAAITNSASQRRASTGRPSVCLIR